MTHDVKALIELRPGMTFAVEILTRRPAQELVVTNDY